jgi:hypothetical protein
MRIGAHTAIALGREFSEFGAKPGVVLNGLNLGDRLVHGLRHREPD